MLKILPAWLWVVVMLVLAVVGIATATLGAVALAVLLPSLGLMILLFAVRSGFPTLSKRGRLIQSVNRGLECVRNGDVAGGKAWYDAARDIEEKLIDNAYDAKSTWSRTQSTLAPLWDALAESTFYVHWISARYGGDAYGTCPLCGKNVQGKNIDNVRFAPGEQGGQCRSCGGWIVLPQCARNMNVGECLYIDKQGNCFK